MQNKWHDSSKTAWVNIKTLLEVSRIDSYKISENYSADFEVQNSYNTRYIVIVGNPNTERKYFRVEINVIGSWKIMRSMIRWIYWGKLEYKYGQVAVGDTTNWLQLGNIGYMLRLAFSYFKVVHSIRLLETWYLLYLSSIWFITIIFFDVFFYAAFKVRLSPNS